VQQGNVVEGPRKSMQRLAHQALHRQNFKTNSNLNQKGKTMKSINSVVISLLLGAVCQHSAFAEESVCSKNFGELKCGAGIIRQINHLGSAELNGTKITEQLQVTGNVNAKNIKAGSIKILGDLSANRMLVKNVFHLIGSVQVNNGKFESEVNITGEGDFANSSFQKGMNITGRLNADSVTLKNELDFKGCRISLNRSKTRDVTIRKEEKCQDGKQLVYLQDGSRIDGDIRFEGGLGQVRSDMSSGITGHVIGGEIIKN